MLHVYGVSLAALERKESSEVVRIMQLGDSHTGGDYFTQAYREQMQKRFGNAGIGWLSPGYIKNQRSAQVLMRMNGNWKTRVSRNNPENFHSVDLRISQILAPRLKSYLSNPSSAYSVSRFGIDELTTRLLAGGS